jgi:hypothetical protein
MIAAALATGWLRREAFTGYPAAGHEYGMAISAGCGVAMNEMLGHCWLRLATAHGD